MVRAIVVVRSRLPQHPAFELAKCCQIRSLWIAETVERTLRPNAELVVHNRGRRIALIIELIDFQNSPFT